MKYDQLKLDNQICFPLYAVSRLITREYQPFLEKLGITYPQYLVLMVLWENDGITVNEISKKLILNTNTITPLLKRMESEGIIRRKRSMNDERKVIVELTTAGKQLQAEASEIPKKIAAGLISETMTVEQLCDLKNKLNTIINFLLEKNSTAPDD
jgi:DNA-binding MarR family transcriptional regulator